MKMNYLMKGMAVMALGLVAVSCNKMVLTLMLSRKLSRRSLRTTSKLKF